MSWHKGRFLNRGKAIIDFVFFVPETKQNTSGVSEIALRCLDSFKTLISPIHTIHALKIGVLFKDDPQRCYRIAEGCPLPDNVLTWIFEEYVLEPAIQDINNIPSIPKVVDEVDEKEVTILEDLLSDRAVSSETLLPTLINNLEVDPSFPDLRSGPVSFIK